MAHRQSRWLRQHAEDMLTLGDDAEGDIMLIKISREVWAYDLNHIADELDRLDQLENKPKATVAELKLVPTQA